MAADTEELPAAHDRFPPGTYELDPSRCVVEFTVRLLGTTVRSRLTATGGGFVIDPQPCASTQLITVDGPTRRLTGPPIGRLLLGDRWPSGSGQHMRCEGEGLRRLGAHAFRMRGTVHVAGETVPVTFFGRVIPSSDDSLIIVGAATLPVATTCWGHASWFRRALLGRRIRLLIAAEFRPA